MIPNIYFFATCFLALIGFCFYMYAIHEASYRLTRYHEKEEGGEAFRLLRVGRIYLVLSTPMTIGLFISYGDAIISEFKFSSLWAFYAAAYIILIAVRILSNPHDSFVDRGWEFHRKQYLSNNQKLLREENLKIKKEYVKTVLKPRMQGIIVSLLFIVSAYILLKTLILILNEGTVTFPFDRITYRDVVSWIIMVLGVIPAVIISEIFLKIFPPLVKE